MAATPRSLSKKTASTPRRPLSRERIVKAALALADSRGDFSMRALGQKLKTDPMAVYRHFQDKEALLDAMVDVALADVAAPLSGSGTAIERLREMSLNFRSALQVHPGVATRVSTTRPTLGPHTVALTEACLVLLHEVGLDAQQATRAFLMLIRFITGVAGAEERVRADGRGEDAWREDLRAGYASVPADAFPNVSAMSNEVAGLGFDSDFEYGLDLLLEGLERRGSASAARPR